MNSNVRIVAGVDGSLGGDRALRWAIHEAGTRGGTVRAVTAYTFDALDGSSVRYREQQYQQVRQMLDAQVARALEDGPRVGVDTQVAFGAAPEVLLDAVENADLLVLGSHGHGRLFHAVLGSVAEACIRRAHCPVVVIPLPREAKVPAAADAAADSAGIPAAIL
jgi:nucleotide-binding universal stress UspA family protein